MFEDTNGVVISRIIDDQTIQRPTERGLIDLLCLTHFQQYFSYIMATSLSSGGGRSTRREPPTMSKQLVNFITCGCESSAPFFVFTKQGANPRRIGDRLV
jgi:hypothetical protein